MFDGTLKINTSIDYEIDLLKGVQSYHAKPFPFLKVHEETLKQNFID